MVWLFVVVVVVVVVIAALLAPLLLVLLLLVGVVVLSLLECLLSLVWYGPSASKEITPIYLREHLILLNTNTCSLL